MSEPKSKLSRRTLFAGTAVAGAAVAATRLLPATGQVPEAVQAPKAPPEKGGGYQLSEHVQRYYKTTRV